MFIYSICLKFGFVIFLNCYVFWLFIYREEKASLSEECQQMANRLEIVRGDLENTELKLEKIKEESITAQHKLQELLLQEQRKREVAEEDCRAQSEVSYYK